MPIDINETLDADVIKLELIGNIDEKAVLPVHPKIKILKIDFAQVTNINSIGVRNFIVWGEKHAAVDSIQLENCPPIFVKNFSGIFGFLKSNMSVISFYAPFYSTETNESTNVHFVSGREFNAQGLLKVPTVKDSKGQPMEIDVSESYFDFLKK